MGFGNRSTGRVLLGANLGRAIVFNGDFTAYVCDCAATRPSSQITLLRLVLFSQKRGIFGNVFLFCQRFLFLGQLKYGTDTTFKHYFL